MFGLVPFAGRHGLSQRANANPFALFDAMRDSFFRDGFPAANWGADSFKVDVKDANDHYELTADLPGMTKARFTSTASTTRTSMRSSRTACCR